MISPGNSHSSQGSFLCSNFFLGSVLCELSEIFLFVMASMRFIRFSPNIKLTAFYFFPLTRELRTTPLQDFSLLPLSSLVVMCIYLTFLLLEGS
jgi:hypothetical protein